MTDEWLDAVRAALAPRGAQAKLAREVKCSPVAIHELLNGGKASYLVPAISKALGIAPPMMIVSPDTHEVVAMLEKMGPQGRRLLKGLAGLSKSEIEAYLTLVEGKTKK